MPYSFTEKKRIRKSFAKRAERPQVPYLLATQIESYAAFLQADAPADAARTQGLQAAFKSVFPISSHSGNARSSSSATRSASRPSTSRSASSAA